MKKKLKLGGLGSPPFKKILVIMRLVSIIILVMTVHVSASVYSQQTKLSLNFENVTIREVLNQIEKQSNYKFLLQNELLDIDKKVSVNAHQSSIDFVLNEIFLDQRVDYVITDKNLIIIRPESSHAGVHQSVQVAGKVTDSSGAPLPGVTVVVKGTTQGTVTDFDGRYTIGGLSANATLVFSFVGMRSQEVGVGNQSTINVVMEEETIGMDEVVVVGYGSQKKSDITGTVASVGQERLQMVPNTTIAQAIQGAIPGVMMNTNSAGTSPNEVIMIRGRNSIEAGNDPLIVVDGVPYGGQLRDINPNDVKSIEVLKDASAAAIYGSRGSNGVILVTTKIGKKGKATISYDGYYGMQSFVKLPNTMSGPEFYEFKKTREPGSITASEQAVYDAGKWTDWVDLALRNGYSTQHNISVSGGSDNTNYYFSGGLTDIQGLAVGDDYQRVSMRFNLDSKITSWLTIGTRTQLTYDNRSGLNVIWDGGTSYNGVFWMNPLTTPYDEDGNQTINPWPEETQIGNPLQRLLADNTDRSYQAVTNNHVVVDVPFIKGLQYRLNSGIRLRFTDSGTYWGRNTLNGLSSRGESSTNRSMAESYTLENIVNYNREFGKHNLFFTGVYSFEDYKNSSNELDASGYPNDFLTWYSAGQAEVIAPDFGYSANTLISQMLRLNYSYDSRYLLTFTVRRDGFSGFGEETKWGTFPSAAVGWNIANEDFFENLVPNRDLISVLKLRASYGLNGNQAIGSYSTIARMAEENFVDGSSTMPGYRPSTLGMDNLGWESSKTFNVGLDYGLLSGRISGDLNYYVTNTFDLLLDRTISPIHGIREITQNIGETRNVGFEASVNSRNIITKDFSWTTSANFSTNKNEIVSLYGELDAEGNEIDDVGNRWFIGEPIRVNYNYIWDGIWQLGEEEEAAVYNKYPGGSKLVDLSGPDGTPDGVIDPNDDRVIQGQRDPKIIWGMNNTLTYKDLTLSVFMHGVHGITSSNALESDNVFGEVKRNTTKKNWWTPDNPTNEWIINDENGGSNGGINTSKYYSKDFVRIKDITLSYDLLKLFRMAGFGKFQVYATGRNLITFTNWPGLDPELDDQIALPLQKEYVFGINLSF
ncbi:SusC/RagA family TonB-linked outer membrane protein [uncultured Sunxiuqinia sp.]|uniref:SusC/RagA family TonB-linked outer membrane protein n=1 Tax=uncultured Sunxiuqinia sp. TaxID=1573825 RepID=UPI0030DD0897